MSGVASAGPTPITVTISLPIGTFDSSVPTSTVIIEPVVTTNIDPSLNYVGFQGDFTFNETVVTFSTPAGESAGLTASNWNVVVHVLPGPGPIRTARLTAFSLDFVPLSGSGTLFNMRMRRVSSTPGAISPLVWSPDPSNFIFVDGDLNSILPDSTPPGSITVTPVCDLTKGFDVITTLVSEGWFMQNNSARPGTTGWFQGSTAVFPSQSGVANSYIAANYDNGTGASTLSNWLLTPPVNLQNGGHFTFWTRTVDTPAYADRLQVRMSTSGASSNVGTTATEVGDFTTLLLDINPTYTLTGYPNVWTQFTLTVSGLGSPAIGRLAFRYFVENGGPTGANSDYIGIDTVHYACAPMPTPTPTPTPIPTPINISGTVSYCSNPVPGPVPNVTLDLTGNGTGSTLSDSSGNYTFSSLAAGGSYTVTPSRATLMPGAAGIDTVDAITTQRHFTNGGMTLSGCRLTAADVNGDSAINTFDVIAIQRFLLGRSTGIANVGKYLFIPASRFYPAVGSNQTSQNYDTLVFGDVASHFVE